MNIIKKKTSLRVSKRNMIDERDKNHLT